MEENHARMPEPNPGLLAGITGLARNAVGLLVNRIELAALELAEVRANLIKILLVAMLGVLAAWFAIACWTALIVVLSWQSLGWKTLLILAAVFTLLTVAAMLYAQSFVKNGKLSMRATLTELRHDRDSLVQQEQR
jgi:uncharacterized membrane protein YqjE